MKVSGITTRPPFGARACAAMVDVNSDVSRTGAVIASTLKCFEGVQKVFGISRRDRIKQDQDPIDVRRNLLEQLQPLADERRLHRNETGDVTARLGEARNEAATDRVDGLSKHDGDCACLLHQRRRGGRALRKNEFGLQRDEFLGVSLSQLRIAWWRPAIVDPDVAILRPSQLLKPLAERCDEGSSVRVALGIRHQHAHAPHALLRTRGARYGRRAAQGHDKVAPPHVSPQPRERHRSSNWRSGRVPVESALGQTLPSGVPRSASALLVSTPEADSPLTARSGQAAYEYTTSGAQRFGRADLAGYDAVPVVEPAPGNPL